MTSTVRVRESLGFTTLPPTRSRTTGYGGAPSGDAVLFQGMALGKKEVMVDTVIKGFRKRQARGEVFFNPMSKTVETIESSGGSVGPRRRSPTTGSTYSISEEYQNAHHGWYGRATGVANSAGWVPPLLTPFIDVEALVKEASTAVLSQRARGTVNMWETLAEADTTLRMVAQIFRAGAKKLSKYSFKGLDKKTAGSYLAWRYGIQPVLLDVYELLTSVDKKLNDRITTRSVLKVEKTASDVVSSTSSQVTVAFERRSNRTVKVRAMALDRVNPFYTGNNGFGTKDLLTLPWELVRLSFVLDWFANVGDYIGALAPDIGFDELGSCYVVSDTIECVSTVQTVTPLPNVALQSGLSGEITHNREQRWRVPRLGAPALTLRSNFGFSSVTRCLDALALMRALIH